MPSYAEWHDFFLGVGSAAAALTGLVFVAISLHPKEIATVPLLRLRASGAMSALVAVLFVGLAQLLPAEVQRAADAVLAVFGLAWIAFGARLQLGHARHPIRSASFGRWLLMGLGSVLVAVGAGGLALAAPDGQWLHVLLAAACFVVLGTALFQCWLLVLQIPEESDSH